MNQPLPGRFVVPEVVASHFHFKVGDVVADFGSGSGFFLKVLTEAVGPTGRVFACEVQKNLVEKLGDQVRLQGLQNVTPLWCDLEESGGIKLRDGVLDGALLSNTLFQLEDKVTAVREMRRTLRSGGVMHIIDWTDSFGGLGPSSAMVITKEQTIDMLEAHGFVFEREYPAGEHHYGLSFRAV
ncbi:methyltransferase domain-containing protein [Patescibacteria group bacterium]|nr:methyltransferase domain-containing protein [Patescibacteria group bacterium]